MRIPKAITIYGKRWTTNYKWNLFDDEGNRCDGLCCKKTRTITLDRYLKDTEKTSTYLHELLHAVLYELKINQTSLDSDVEEIIVAGIEEFIMENFTFRLKKKS